MHPENTDSALNPELEHLAYSLVHNGVDPPRGFGGCSCEVCNALRVRMMEIRQSEASEYLKNRYVGAGEVAPVSPEPTKQEWCPIHGGLRDAGTPCMYCPSESQPVSAMEDSCGSAKNAEILTSEDFRPTANDASDSVGLLLPDQEWNQLSKDSQAKVKKWFELATERLQLILDGEPVSARTDPIAELIEVRIKGKGRREEFACLMGYQPPEGTEVISRTPLYAAAQSLSAQTPPAELAEDLARIRAAWVVFYAGLPDGEYEGLGQMRIAMEMPDVESLSAQTPPAKEEK